MSLLNRIRSAVAGFLTGGGHYNSTNPRRTTRGGRGRNNLQGGTANEVITPNLPMLRNQCRQLERNNPTARAVINAWEATVVGTGIDIFPDFESEDDAEKVLAVWERVTKDIGINRESLYELQRMAIREDALVGESVQRIVWIPDPADATKLVPRVIPLESEWIADDVISPVKMRDGNWNIAGVHIDSLGRKVSYLLRNPGYDAPIVEEPVSASAILHTYECKRAYQVRGEPVLAPVIETLGQEEDLITAELESAINGANVGVIISSPQHPEFEPDPDNDPVQNMELGGIGRVWPGDEVTQVSSTRPSQQIAPFSQFLRHRIAAATRVSNRLLDRDVSRANFNSMLADNIDTERLLGPTRERFGHQHTGKLFLQLLPWLCAKAGVAVPEDPAYHLVPDETPYVNPRVEVQSSKDAIEAGLTTREKEIGKRGGNWRRIIEQGNREQSEIARAKLALIADVKAMADAANAANPGLNLDWSQLLAFTAGQKQSQKATESMLAAKSDEEEVEE